MSTQKIIYSKILEISSKYLSGHPPIYVSSIAEELKLPKDIVTEHLTTLKNQKLIDYDGSKNELIILRNLKGNLPEA